MLAGAALPPAAGTCPGNPGPSLATNAISAPEPQVAWHIKSLGRYKDPLPAQAALLSPAPTAAAREEAAAALAHLPLQRALLRDPRALYPRLSALAPVPTLAGIYPPLCAPPSHRVLKFS